MQAITLTLLAIAGFFALFGNETTQASYTHNDQQGIFSIDFLGSEGGIDTTNNITIDTTQGTAQIADSIQGNSIFKTIAIEPLSFTNFKTLTLDGIITQTDDITISLYDCNDTTPIPNFEDRTLSGNQLDLTSLNSQDHDCIQVEVTLHTKDPNDLQPSVNTLLLTWDPQPVLLTRITSPEEKPTGDTLTYGLNYAVSFADANNTILYLPLPTPTQPTPSYNQDLTLNFLSATRGGIYTESEITINNTTIPSNSVYWDLGTIPAGQTGLLSAVYRIPNNLENQTTYTAQSTINADIADNKTSNQTTTTITSTPSPQITKSTQGTVSIGQTTYVLDQGAFSPNITYNINLSNLYAPRQREAIFMPTYRDDLSDLFTFFQTTCNEPNPEQNF